MSSPDLGLRCHGCAAIVDPLDTAAGFAFRCPNTDRAPALDHVLCWDPVDAGITEWPLDGGVNPFVRYRTLQHWYWTARQRGLDDEQTVAAVARIDQALSLLDPGGHGFVITPFDVDTRASEAAGVEVWAKDETGNVAGSHKARHLMGLALHLDVQKVSTRSRLAIASCGNAAIAAATVARATRRFLDVFVPADAPEPIVERLGALGASVTSCVRQPGTPPGDPCLIRFREAVRKGGVPFSCQGPDNGLTIDGGRTLGFELASQLGALGWVPDRLLVQVGGGALGTSVASALRIASRLGAIGGEARLHFVQTEGAAPLARAWGRVAVRARRSLGLTDELVADDPESVAATAATLAQPASAEAVDEALRFAVTHRANFMWPWEDVPSSVASGILDDETYDWYELVAAMVRTGGWPIIVSERELERANQACQVLADETGSAGLAGLLALHRSRLTTAGERAAVIYTGLRRF